MEFVVFGDYFTPQLVVGKRKRKSESEGPLSNGKWKSNRGSLSRSGEWNGRELEAFGEFKRPNWELRD
jgi:hypothetical protein